MNFNKEKMIDLNTFYNELSRFSVKIAEKRKPRLEVLRY